MKRPALLNAAIPPFDPAAAGAVVGHVAGFERLTHNAYERCDKREAFPHFAPVKVVAGRDKARKQWCLTCKSSIAEVVTCQRPD